MTERRLTAFGVGLMLAGLAGFAAVSGEPPEHRDPTLKAQLCAAHGVSHQQCERFEADHIVPLCLRIPGLDVLANMQLQTCDAWRAGPHGIPICVAGLAYRKDLVEKEVCSKVRRGLMTPEQAARVFATHKGGW